MRAKLIDGWDDVLEQVEFRFGEVPSVGQEFTSPSGQRYRVLKSESAGRMKLELLVQKIESGLAHGKKMICG
jgi:hypothetical protein